MSIREFSVQIQTQETGNRRADQRSSTAMGAALRRQQGEAKEKLVGSWPIWPSY